MHRHSVVSKVALALLCVLGVSCGGGSSKDKATSKEITAFSFTTAENSHLSADVIGTIIGTEIAVTVPYGTDVTALTPTITITGVSIVPADKTEQNFTNPVEYTVTAEDGSTQKYIVTVTVASSSAKEITKFTILGVDGTISGTAIAITLPYDTDVTALTPTISITGKSINPSSGVAEDFTNPVEYTVTAEDGTTKTYTVTVTVAPSSAKEITKLTILGVDGTISGTAIAITLPYGTNVTALTPTITATGASVSPASGAEQDFTNPVEYTVTAEDGSTQKYTITVTVATGENKDITKFTILGIDATITGTAIAITLPYGTEVTDLTPNIVHTGASINPASGVAHDFTSPVDYTVTALNSTTKTYSVTVSVALNSAKEITRFSLLGIDGTISGNSIALTLPYGTDVTALTPTMVHTGVSVDPGNAVPQDFTDPVEYTVTAEDGTTKTYTVTVTVAPSSSKELTFFSINGIDGMITGTDIALTVPYGTDVTALTPTIVHTGASIAPASGTPQDFTNAVQYTVTAADTSTKVYTVNVGVASATTKEITKFTLLGLDADIIGADITLTVPHGTALGALTPTIVHTGVSISPPSGTPQDFTSAVQYTVTAGDTSTRVYTVHVTPALDSSKDITTFSIQGIAGAITDTDTVHTIALTLPFGTDVSALTPMIVHTGVSINPPSGVLHSFATPVEYTVTAEDGTTKTYTVTVHVAPSTSKDIVKFTILGVDGTITDTDTVHTITLTVPYGTSLVGLTPYVQYTGESIDPPSGLARTFTTPINYEVTAADGSTKTYVVTVSVASATAKEITKFTLLGVNGNISGTNITFTFPYGIDVSHLTPNAIVYTGASVAPLATAPQDFRVPVHYTVTAGDATHRTYTVTVSIAPNTEAKISSFSILGIAGTITDTDTVHTIALTVPYSTDLAHLTPTIVVSPGATVAPNTGVERNFTTSPVNYVVTAQDGTTRRTYAVTVTRALNTAADITQFTLLGANGTITGTDIALRFPSGTNVSNLTPTIAISPDATISPLATVAQNFNSPVTYTVTAQNGTTQKTYTVRVTLGACIKINEVRLAGNSNEFVELYNACGISQSIATWDLFLVGATSPLTTFAAGTTIAGGAYHLVNYSASTNELPSTSGTTLRLRDGADAVVDAVTWGGTGNSPIPGNGHSIGRYPNGADTDSGADFFDYATPTPGAANTVKP